ncbi:MAG: N-glycosylase/DNA lyase [candidate division WOR-3 bacterium]
MDKLLQNILELKKSELKKVVDARLNEFSRVGAGQLDGIFNELCFCILTANCSAERGIRAQKEIGDGFSALPEPELKAKVREIVCRFYNNQTRFIIEARCKKAALVEALRNKNGKEVREWLVKNVKGLGYKEASHFLRNIGYSDVAIVDFHIMDLLERHGVIKRSNVLTRKKYLEIEDKLRRLSVRAGLSLAELDLYLWYGETGKVLK